MPKFFITHITQYQYSLYSQYSANRIMLYPLHDTYQTTLLHELNITTNPSVSIHKDYYGNEVGTFTIVEPHLTLTIESTLEINTHPRKAPIDTQSVDFLWAELHQQKLQIEMFDFLKLSIFSFTNEFQAVFNSIFDSTITPFQLSQNFCNYVFSKFKYIKGITSFDSTIEEVWKHQSGVCQDFAHILLELLRQAKIPSRYVSGYICPHQNGMRGEGATHAWVEIYLPEFGWLGLDPTNNCIVNDTHVRLAVGKNFDDCSPVKGIYRGGSEHHLHVSVYVSYEDGSNIQGEAEVDFVSEKKREQEFMQSQQ